MFERVGAEIGQPFVYEARTGAAGAIGTDFVAKSAPDGYTLILGTASTFGTNSSTQKNLPYDPVRDFTPIVMIASTPYLLLVHPSVPANSPKELVAYSKAVPGKLNFGSFGNGSSTTLWDRSSHTRVVPGMRTRRSKASSPATARFGR